MVLYGIWLIDANSGLLLSHITIPGFTFNPDLFSGFIAATHDFAKESSGGKLNSIALGNFKLLIRRDRILLKVLAVGARDPEARYNTFMETLETQIDPLLANLHREPNGFKAVTKTFRKEILEIITAELEQFNTRKAPSDLAELTILHEKPARNLLQALLQQPQRALLPELAITRSGFSYPLVTSLTKLDDDAAYQLLERLEEYGILLSEPTETALACMKCQSLHLHPHLLCPTCHTSALPVKLFEHLTCGHIGIKYGKDKELHCLQCGALQINQAEFRVFLGYQCLQCNKSFSNPEMIFVCHACHSIVELEEAEVTTLKKYILNPTFIPELEILNQLEPQVTNSTHKAATQHLLSSSTTTPQPQPKHETTISEPDSIAEITEPAIPTPQPRRSNDDIVSTDETHLLEELQKLERALKEGTITEAEYDRKFVRLRLQLRQLRSQPAL
jgi:Fe2+ or Zn2+ uptake regulation protein